MQLLPCHGSSAAVAPEAGRRDRPEVSPLYPPPLVPVPWGWPVAQECNADCQGETPQAPEQAEGGWHTHPAGLSRAEGHQDNKRSRMLLGQLTHTPGDTPFKERWATHAQS